MDNLLCKKESNSVGDHLCLVHQHWRDQVKDRFYYMKNGKLVGMLALYVDDALCAGSARFDQDVTKPMMIRFNFGRNVEDEYRTPG